MKRLIAAAALAALAVPAFAVEIGQPFEQTELDRTLPQVNIPAHAQRSADRASLPYEQAQVDRMLPTFDSSRMQFAAVSGSTVSDASIATQTADASQATQSPWANDWNFIAPAL
jgi:hypothetical protein